MALVVADRVRETTTTEGTGTITLGGAVANFETFTANLSDSDTTYYAIVDSSNNAFEVGLGTFTASGTTLARTTIIASSNSNNAVNFGAGTKDVFITIPASKMIVKDASGNVSGSLGLDGNVTIVDGSNDFDVASHDGTNGLKLGGTLVTSSAAELNILDGKSFVDEDNMASNSATAIPSQQSVKAYVDTQLTAEDLDVTTDSGTIDIDLDSETLTIAGGTGLSSSASSTTVTMAVDAAQTGITSVVNTSLEIGRDADNRIKFGTDNQIIFEVDGGDNVIFKASGEIEATSLDISGDVDVDGTLEADAITVDGTALATVIAGTTVNNATLASTVTVSDSTANTNFPVVFHDESNALLDDTGALRYNPSTGELLVPKLTVAGTTTTVDTVTMNAQNAVVFEGATADSNETTLTITDPTADRTITLPDATGQVVLSSGAIDSDAIAEIGRAHIGNIGFSDMAGFSHVDQNTAASYAILQNASGTTFLNAADGQVINFNINNSNVMNVESTGLSLFAGKNIVFEGSTSDDFETFINVIDPTADRSINFPDASGTISLITATETLTNKTLTTPVIAEIDNSGDITLDAGGDIILDAGGEEVIFKDGSTNVGQISTNGDNLTIQNLVQDKDIIFKGNDGGVVRDLLTFDVSNFAQAIFVGGVTGNSYFWMNTDGNVAMYGGENFEIALTHVHNTGFKLTNGGTGTPAVELQFVDSNESIGSDGTNLILTSGGNAITVPNTGADTATLNAATQTLTNKTLTSPKINEDVVLTATATELNLMDGGTSAGTTAVAGGDGIVTNDNGTMRQTTVDTFDTYLSATTKTLTNKTLTTPVINGFSGTGDGSIIGDLTAKTSDGAILKLQTSETAVNVGDVLGAIEFSAPDETSGGDADNTAFSITAFADSTFSNSSNKTDLVFKADTTEVMRVEHQGNIVVGGNITAKDSLGAVLTLQTSIQSVGSTQTLGAINFQAPDETSGGDADNVAASIVAQPATSFTSTNNSTDLIFKLGVSGTATEKMRFTHDGNLSLTTDAAVLGFGADTDVTLTHVADTGLLLNSTRQLQFNDASQYINAPSATVLDINATDEIELNATLVDVNANLDVSGTYTGGGLMTTGGNIVIPDAGTIGSASDTDAISIASDGKTTFSQNIIASGNIELGNASDTTLARSSAGVVTIEGNTIATREQLKGDATNGAGVFSDELIARKLHTGTIITSQDDSTQGMIAGRPMGGFFSQLSLTGDRIYFMPIMIPGTGASNNFTVGSFQYRTGFSGTVTDRTVKMGLYTLNTQGYPSQLVSKSSASSGSSLNTTVSGTPDVTSITPGRYALALVSVAGSTLIVTNFNSSSAGASFYQEGFTDLLITGKPTGLALDGAMSSGNLPTDLSSTSGYTDQSTVPFMMVSYGSTYTGE